MRGWLSMGGLFFEGGFLGVGVFLVELNGILVLFFVVFYGKVF